MHNMEEIIASGWDCGGGEHLEHPTCWLDFLAWVSVICVLFIVLSTVHIKCL